MCLWRPEFLRTGMWVHSTESLDSVEYGIGRWCWIDETTIRTVGHLLNTITGFISHGGLCSLSCLCSVVNGTRIRSTNTFLGWMHVYINCCLRGGSKSNAIHNNTLSKALQRSCILNLSSNVILLLISWTQFFWQNLVCKSVYLKRVLMQVLSYSYCILLYWWLVSLFPTYSTPSKHFSSTKPASKKTAPNFIDFIICT